MDTTPKIILENPYRILGVYANSAKRDIVANKGRATAFLKVKRPVKYPLDLEGIMPPLTRTLDSMNDAEAHLAIAKEKIKYAQFWFLKMTPIDDVAFNHLISGDMYNALLFWKRQDSLSSMQNRMICFFIKGDYKQAMTLAEQLYVKYGNSYISNVDASSTLKMDDIELVHLFIDSLSECFDLSVIMRYVIKSEWKQYISKRVVGPLINRISLEIETTKRVNHKNPKARLDAARRLVKNTKDSFSQLKSLLSSSDSQFQMIADKLGLEILQCGIDYFLGRKNIDDEAPYKAMKMLKYAKTVVIGKIANDRCDDQISELQKYIDNLPPKEVMAEDRAIKAELSKFVRLPDKISYAVDLLDNTEPHLQSIKNKLGATNSYYLKLSTQIVGNALHGVVEEVNAVQKNNVIELGNGLTFDLDDIMTPERRLAKYDRIKSTVRKAWEAMAIMDKFDLEPQFKSHYDSNKRILKSMCKEMGISTTTINTSTLTALGNIPFSHKQSHGSTTTPKNTSNKTSSSGTTNGKGKIPSWVGNCVGCFIIIIVAFILLVIIISIIKGVYSSSTSSNVVQDTYTTSVVDSFEYDEDNVSSYTNDDEDYYEEVLFSTGDRPYQSYYGRGEYDGRSSNSLLIKNEYGRDAVVFLETTSGNKIRHVYIKANENYTMNNIPAGRYIVKIMQGNSWNPNKDNGYGAPIGGFMNHLSMSESGSGDIMEFPSVDSGQYGTFEITLYKVENGNMYTRDIDSKEMFN